MKRKLLFMVLILLTASDLRSQDTISEPSPALRKDSRPVAFPFWMVREIAKDLEEKQWLDQENLLQEKALGKYRLLVQGLEEKERNRKLQLKLLEKNSALLHDRLRAEKQINKRGNVWIWSLRLLGALGAGFVLGRI